MRKQALIVIAACLLVVPFRARAQNPPFLLQWGSLGTEDGQFRSTNTEVGHDAAGDIYVLETNIALPKVQKFTNYGRFLMRWGPTQLNPDVLHGVGPNAITGAVGGGVYISDDRIQWFSVDGLTRTTIVTSGSAEGHFQGSYGMDTDAAGNLYVADYGNQRVDIFSSTGAFLGMWGSGGTAAGQLNYPCGIAVEPSGNVIVADLTPRVQRFTASGSYLGTLAVGGSGEGQLGSCCWTQVDVDPDGRIFVTDIGNNRILVFAADGSFGAQWGSLGSGPGQFNLPTGLTIDSYDNVYVFDRGNSRVEKFGYVTPTLSTSWGRLKAIYK